MATKRLINGKYKSKAGVYSTVKSAIKNPSTQNSYSNILIIDDGIGASFGGGSGINGTIKKGADAIYSFDNLSAFQGFVKGGVLWKLGEPLFNPSGSQNGVSKLFFVRAATTTPAEMAWITTNGTFKIRTKDEGKNANGVLNGTNLVSGYSSNFVEVSTGKFVFQIYHGSYKGLDLLNGVSFDGVSEVDAKPELVIESPVFSKLTDLYNWFANSDDFNTGFELVESSLKEIVDETPATATITANAAPQLNERFVVWVYDPAYNGYVALADLNFDDTVTTGALAATAIANAINNSNQGYSAVAAGSVVTITARNGLGATINNVDPYIYTSSTFDYSKTKFTGGVNSAAATGLITTADTATKVLASGGTETYNAADFDSVLSKINGLDFVHILSMRYGLEGTHANNVKLETFVEKNSKYDRILVTAGGYDKSERSLSKQLAAFFDSSRVVTVHGGIKKTVRKNKFKVYDALFHAAYILGRCAGLPPQVPVTSKSIDVDGFVDPLEDDDQEDLIASGVLHSFYDTELGGVYVVGLDVNTLQHNDNLINDDGTTYNWALKRIEADLNKDIVISGKKRFFDPQSQGGNRFTTSPEEVVVWAQKKLKDRQAGDKGDDLIISFKNVQATLNQDNISLTYDFVPNTEVKMVISTGTMIEG